MNNIKGNYSYYRLEDMGRTFLLRDDSYRMEFIREKRDARTPFQEGVDDDWTHFVEYKQCDFPGIADTFVLKFLGSLEPAPIDTIDARFFDV